MNIIDRFIQYFQENPSGEINWDRIGTLLPPVFFDEMRKTPQNPVYHREGDVYSHTQRVCGELVKNPAFRELNTLQKAELFLAAVFHDIGKVKTTRMENGNWTSPHHASVGSQIVREFLWRECGICGNSDLITFRETVCALVRWHMLPVHLPDQKDPERKITAVSTIGEPAHDFSWYLLCMLSEADVRGRIADDIEECLTQVKLSGLLAEEKGCLHGPRLFAGSMTKYAYLTGRNVLPDQVLYDDTWGEVIMLSGLPGTGKDTWIEKNHPDLPVISLDALRDEFNVKPGENQGQIIQLACERAKIFCGINGHSFGMRRT